MDQLRSVVDERLARLSGWLLLAFVGVNLIAILMVSSDSFRQLGSLWFAVFITFAGGVRYIMGGEFLRTGPSDEELKKKFREPIGRFAHKRREDFRSVLSNSTSAYEAADLAEGLGKEADLVKAGSTHHFGLTELLALCLATLQWRYGDQLSILIFGEEVQLCEC